MTVTYPLLALQLRFLFDMGEVGCGLMSASKERPSEDMPDGGAASGHLHGVSQHDQRDVSEHTGPPLNSQKNATVVLAPSTPSGSDLPLQLGEAQSVVRCVRDQIEAPALIGLVGQ